MGAAVPRGPAHPAGARTGRRLATELPGVADMLAKVAEGIAVEGMESLAPALVDGMESVLDVLPARSVVVLADGERIRTRAHDLVATSDEFLQASWANAAAGNASRSTSSRCSASPPTGPSPTCGPMRSSLRAVAGGPSRL